MEHQQSESKRESAAGQTGATGGCALLGCAAALTGGGDAAKSPDSGVTDSFSGTDVASITPFPGQAQSSTREASARTRVGLADNSTPADQGHAHTDVNPRMEPFLLTVVLFFGYICIYLCSTSFFKKHNDPLPLL